MELVILTEAIDRFSAIHIKVPTLFFIDLERTILNFIWKDKKFKIAKTILNNKRTGGITIADFKQYYRTIVIKTSWYWYRNRQVDQGN